MADEDDTAEKGSSGILSQVEEIAGTHNAQLMDERNTPHIPNDEECELYLDELENLRKQVEKQMVLDPKNETTQLEEGEIGVSREFHGGTEDIRMITKPISYGTLYIDADTELANPLNPVLITSEEHMFLDPSGNFSMEIIEQVGNSSPKITKHSISKTDPYKNKVHKSTPSAIGRAKSLMRLYLES